MEFENFNFRRNTEPRELRKIPSYTNYLNFIDVIYFMFVTLTTIGFGDITPQSLMGRISIILSVAIIIPTDPTIDTLPQKLWGEISPNPIVVNVTKIK